MHLSPERSELGRTEQAARSSQDIELESVDIDLDHVRCTEATTARSKDAS
jgi:hypothetical protein